MTTIRHKLKECYEAEKKIEPFFTGRLIQWTKDGEHLLCHDGSTINVFSLDEGKVIGHFGDKEALIDAEVDSVTAVTESNSGEFVYTCNRSGLMNMYDKKEQKLLKTWKSVHKGHVLHMSCTDDANWLATAGTDSTVKIWNLNTLNCVQSLKGCQGIISVLKFRPDTKEIYAVGDDSVIHCWEVGKNYPKLLFKSHYSTVTAIVFHNTSKKMISCGRDSVVCVWDLVTGKPLRVVPVFEAIEDMVLLPTPFSLPGGIDVKEKLEIYVATAGEKGIIRVWQIEKSKEIFTQKNSKVSQLATTKGSVITNLLFNEDKRSFAVVSHENNIIFHHLEDFECYKSLAGCMSEIMDVALIGPNESHIAVASNTSDIKLYRLQDLNCELLNGHTATVLTLVVAKSNPCLLASGAKDNSIRLWLFDPITFKSHCVGIGERHTASVGAVRFSNLNTTWLVSVAQDECLKAWKISADITDLKSSNNVRTLSTEFSSIAHPKDINCVDISPNDKLVVTASQDKTIKLWSLEDLKLVGVMHGHKKGVWCAKFSPTDQVVVSSGGDLCLKIWSIAELSCIRTISCFDASMLRIEFLSHGAQMVTAGGEGTVKLWTIKDSENPVKLDEHSGRVWALTVSKDENMVITGGTDSILIIWKDVTTERKEEQLRSTRERVDKEQRLANLMHAEEFDAALELALSLNRPKSALTVVEGILKKEHNKNLSKLGPIISRLPEESLRVLIGFTLTWNMNSRTCEAAQLILDHILTEGNIKLSPEEVAQAMAYTDQHFRRLSQLVGDMHFLSYTADCMALLPSDT